MNEFLNIAAVGAIAVPLGASIVFTLFGLKSEWAQRNISRAVAILTFLCSAFAIGISLAGPFPREVELGTWIRPTGYQFLFVLYFDRVSLTFLAVTACLASLVVRYSRVYLHREPGYQRFFACIFLLWSGLNLLFTAGTLDLLFAGWEMVGASSFLLIGFYWQRWNPAQNAFRAYCVYRFCDLGLLLETWLNHILLHDVARFSEFVRPQTLFGLASAPPLYTAILGGLVILAACGKSAQIPFLFWLPKAMEGPTPSSAIFYGALSVHAGVFLLMRTFPIWQASPVGPIAVGTIGLATCFVATVCGRSQSNIKAQIAYASAAQVGLQFFELSVGLQGLALIHFVTNAAFRCYQLLVSPSIVAYLLRLQGSVSAQLDVSNRWSKGLLPRAWRSSLYVFSISDGYTEAVWMFLLQPLLVLQRALRLRTFWIWVSWLGSAVAVVLVGVSWMGVEGLSIDAISWIFCLSCVVASTLAITEPTSLKNVWAYSGVSNLLAAVAVMLQQPEAVSDVLVFVGGLAAFWAVGMGAISKLEGVGSQWGRAFLGGAGNRSPRTALLLVVCFLGVSGFPLSPTFIGEDLMLHHATQAHPWMAAVVAITFLVNAVSIARALVPLHFSDYVH